VQTKTLQRLAFNYYAAGPRSHPEHVVAEARHTLRRRRATQKREAARRGA
jgi:hypothetical protein